MTILNIPLQSIQTKPYLWAVYQTTDNSKSHSVRTQEVETLVKKRSEMWNHKDIRPIQINSEQEWLTTLEDVEAINNVYRFVISTLSYEHGNYLWEFNLCVDYATKTQRLSLFALEYFIKIRPFLFLSNAALHPNQELIVEIPTNQKIYKLPETIGGEKLPKWKYFP